MQLTVSRGHVSAILLSHGVCISVYVDQCYFIFFTIGGTSPPRRLYFRQRELVN